MTAIEIYKSLSQPPATALRQITAGNLKGKTDINPQWRYEAMTEKFGLVGIGWKYEIQKLWTEKGAKDEVLAFAQVAVFIRNADTKEWSDPIVGIGGSKLVNAFNAGLQSNDEGYKMAVTDAFSTSLKMLGVAADIYAGRWDGSKYKNTPQEQQQSNNTSPSPNRSSQPQQQRQATPQMKGGPDTQEERELINELLGKQFSDGSLVFTKEECAKVGTWRQSRTAKQVIDYLSELYIERKNQKEPGEEFPEDLPFKEIENHGGNKNHNEKSFQKRVSVP